MAFRPVRRGPPVPLPHPDGKTPSCPAGGGGQLRAGLFQPMKLQITEFAKCHPGNQLPSCLKPDVTEQHTGGHENNGEGTSVGIRDAAARRLPTAAGCNSSVLPYQSTSPVSGSTRGCAVDPVLIPQETDLRYSFMTTVPESHKILNQVSCSAEAYSRSSA